MTMMQTVLAGAAIAVALASPASADPTRTPATFINALARTNACLCHDGGALDGMAGVLLFSFTADPNHAGNNVIHVSCGITSYDANNDLDNLSFTDCAGAFEIMSKK
jgi:hypothetical protein